MITANTPLRVALSGANGFLGSAVATALANSGYVVVPIRRGGAPGPEQIAWDGASVIAGDRLRSCDAVIHLAGAGIADKRWTQARMRELRDSRIIGTTAIANLLAADPGRVQTLICASGSGWYGDRGDEVVNESAASGHGFLAELCRDWERACDPARSVVRVVHLRLGIVLGAGGGALAKMVTPARWGMSGALGSGQQWWPWIARDDAVAVMLHLLATTTLRGPINVVAPQLVRQRELARALAAACHRPAWGPPIPAWALRLLIGRMADEALLCSARIEPAQLQASGFRWTLGELGSALAHEMPPS
ncbi:MAG: TIGR01777 family oxidoreductase [Planctomycetota bacterium]